MSLLITTCVCLAVAWVLRELIRIYTKLTCGRCACSVYLSGKTALITGGNSGIGYQTALALAGRGCRVIIADKDNCDKTKESIINQTGNMNIVTKQFDLASLNSVRELAKDINASEERLDILINNAGTGGLGNAYTEDGLHLGMQVNYFGSFLLTHLLIDLLKKSAPSRIIFVSSVLSFTNDLTVDNLNYPKDKPVTMWTDLMVYGNSKLCAIMCAQELTKKLKDSNVTANALHPGLVNTLIFKKASTLHPKRMILYNILKRLILNPWGKTPNEGAQTTIHLALARDLENVSGEFFSNCKILRKPSKAANHVFSKEIWEASEKLVQLKSDEILKVA